MTDRLCALISTSPPICSAPTRTLLRPLAGKPAVYHALETLDRLGCAVVLASESPTLRKSVRQHFPKTTIIDANHADGEERTLAGLFERCFAIGGVDVVFALDPSFPLVSFDTIDMLLDVLRAGRARYDALEAVAPAFDGVGRSTVMRFETAAHHVRKADRFVHRYEIDRDEAVDVATFAGFELARRVLEGERLVAA